MVPDSASAVPPMPMLKLEANDASRSRKSALVDVDGSPHKAASHSPQAKRGKVCSSEELAESINTLPAMLDKMAAAAKIFTDGTERESTAKDAQIKTLMEQLSAANEKIRALEAEQANVNGRIVDAMVRAAKAEGIAEQLKENLASKERQMETWVRKRFAIASHLAHFSSCEHAGSVISPCPT